MKSDELQQRAINTIRFLAADAVEKANSGHPGLPMGMAAVAYLLWTQHMKYDPQHPEWPNRDRFVLSAGHGSMLLYAMLHLTGYDLSLDELKQFRQLGSKTPGHPEYGLTPGVETTTGPLGQGFANGVGMALAAAHLAAVYNREGFPLIDHFIYGIVSDGDLMEGIASEAASLAGHLKLGRLIYVYDNNHITIDGSTDLAFTEDRAKRFDAYEWQTISVDDANDLGKMDQALRAAKNDDRPSLILARSHIGYGLPTKQDTAAAHGEPPGEEELAGAKEKLGWPEEPRFLVPDDVRDHFNACTQAGREERTEWISLRKAYAKAFPELSAQFERTQAGEMPEDFERSLPVFEADKKGMATRVSSGKTLNALAGVLPELIGGSADLTGSNKTDIKGEPAITPELPGARYIHFGVREHAMGGMLNGMALTRGLIPYGGTFLVFSDYMRPAIRLAAMMGLRVIYVFTHDSIGLGEDGPTHQPIGQLAALRAIPKLHVLRPADANEAAYAWLSALQYREGPTALALTRQNVATLDRTKFAPAQELLKGAYVLADLGKGDPQLILMASGSEVGLIMQAAETLVEAGIAVRLVSFPSWELFKEQSESYRLSVLPTALKARIAVEAGATLGWKRWVGDGGIVIGLDRFGESAPYQEIYADLGLTPERIVREAKALLKVQ
jgi:transketolase